jgi:hypothetical protein
MVAIDSVFRPKVGSKLFAECSRLIDPRSLPAQKEIRSNDLNLDDEESINFLAKRFQVSAAAMSNRLMNLQLFTLEIAAGIAGAPPAVAHPAPPSDRFRCFRTVTNHSVPGPEFSGGIAGQDRLNARAFMGTNPLTSEMQARHRHQNGRRGPPISPAWAKAARLHFKTAKLSVPGRFGRLFPGGRRKSGRSDRDRGQGSLGCFISLLSARLSLFDSLVDCAQSLEP